MVESMSPASKVWIYQSKRPLAEEEATALRLKLQNFAYQWTSHNLDLRAEAKLVHNRFVVLMVDESRAGASGCSIDKSVHFLKMMEQEYQTNFFDRMIFSYLLDDEVITVNQYEFSKRYQQGNINDDTLVFDTLVKTKEAFDTKWLVPLRDSWHRRMV